MQRLDYTAPAFWIETVELAFDLDPAKTRVLNKMQVRRNPEVPAQPLRLDGEDTEPGPRAGQWRRHLVQTGQAAQLVLENLPEGPEPFRAGNLHHLRTR